jgi:sec-independent protein translocase protein TatA
VHPILAEIFGLDGVIVLIIVIAVLFGSTQIPKLARSLGSAQSEFKKGLAEGAKGDSAADESNVGDKGKDSDKPSAASG